MIVEKLVTLNSKVGNIECYYDFIEAVIKISQADLAKQLKDQGYILTKEEIQ